MIKLTSSVNGKDVYVFVNHIVAMRPDTTGTEILTVTGNDIRVKETIEDILSEGFVETTPQEAANVGD